MENLINIFNSLSILGLIGLSAAISSVLACITLLLKWIFTRK